MIGRKRIEFPEEIKLKILDLNKDGIGPTKISTILRNFYDIDVSFQTINNRLKEWNIKKGI